MIVGDQVLWDDFLHWTACTGHYKKRWRDNPYLRPMKATPDRLRLMAEMREWCVGRGIPVRQWLYSLFATRRWLYAPRLDRSFLCSEKHIPRFKKFRDYDLYSKRIRDLENLRIESFNGFDPNRDINHTAEEAKRFYLSSGRIDLCIENMDTETFGYHPKSQVCEKCVQKDTCSRVLKGKVSFDVIALREGKITSQEAYRSAMRASYGN